MVEFIYNNTKNANIANTFFKLNYKFYLSISFKKDINFQSLFYSAKKLAKEPKDLMSICQQNIIYV